jgi:hypothetical protein
MTQDQYYWDLTGANDRIGQPITDAAVAMPDSIEILHDHLVWSARGRFKRLKHPEAVLDAFLRLASENEPDAVLNFAKAYGPLWLCKKHGIAAWHRPLAQVRNAFGPALLVGEEINLSSLWCVPGGAREHFYEPLVRWRTLAIRARNLLLIAAQLHRGQRPSRETWAEHDGETEDFRKLGAWAWLADPWNRLAENLNWWLECANAAAMVEAQAQKPRLVLRSRFLPSALSIIALQLILAAMGAQGLFTCRCGAPFVSQHPKRIYCDACLAKKIPERDAARAYRKRKADAKRTKIRQEA